MGALFLSNFLRFLLVALWLLILARVLLSWVDPTGRSRFAGFIFSTSEPILAPIRRVLPQMGGLDLAPFIVLVVLGALMRAIP